MKQPGLFFILFGAIYLFLGDVRAGLALTKSHSAKPGIRRRCGNPAGNHLS